MSTDDAAVTVRQLLPCGGQAVLVQCRSIPEVLALADAVRRRFAPALVDVVPGAATLLVEHSVGTATDRADLMSFLARATVRVDHDHPIGRLVEIPVSYDGDDLAAVARLCSVSPDEVVQAHLGQVWSVAFCGFSPGFAYLAGETDALRVPRRSSPRTAVPAGTVGLADGWSAVYPRTSPGGWQLIGRTTVSLWDHRASPPALLSPGDRVRFTRVGP